MRAKLEAVHDFVVVFMVTLPIAMIVTISYVWAHFPR